MKEDLTKKFTTEIENIFKSAIQESQDNGYSVLSFEEVLYTIIREYYLDNPGNEHVELTDFIKNMPSGDIVDLLDDLRDETGAELQIGSGNYAYGFEMSEDLFAAVERSKLTAGIKSDGKISIYDLLPAMLSKDDVPCVDILDRYGINFMNFRPDVSTDDLFEKMAKAAGLGSLFSSNSDTTKVSGGRLDDLFNNKSDDPTGILKEKRLSYDDKDPDKARKAFEKAEKAFEAAGKSGAVSGIKADPNSKTPNLDQFAINMNEKAKSKKGYDPVIGRDKEIKEIIRILSCRLCNNPMLLGDPGCGKTAIVEHLASLIAAGDPIIPESLKDKRIFNLDVNAVVAGCMYRGQFEERMQEIIKEVIAEENIIIYIDEIHNMVGAGAGQQDKGDMANILKPFLSRGEFQCIGSTTTGEYRKVIEKDKALVRRFDPLFIGEPNLEDTVAIIKGLSDKYETYHKVKYSDEAIRACVEWSDRYIYDSFFPAKAVKIMDKAGANVKIERPRDLSAIDKLKADIEYLETKKLEFLDNPDDWENMGIVKDDIDAKRKELAKMTEKVDKDKSSWPKITVDDVCKVISSTTGVPLDKIKSTDMDKVREMKSQLDSKVIGQAEAIEELSLALQQNMLGLRDPKKPIASFLFVGPTGVGKTLISKTVAEQFFGSDKNLVTIACSEYMQDWAESKLLGSAPGYVGFDSSEPRLYILKRQPYTVLLIDEIEKSSKNLYNIWLNMLEEGEVTLSSGEKISCRNCIIIFTGNVGTKSLEAKGAGIGFGKAEGEEKKKVDTTTIMKEVEKEFRPEFLNRLSKIVVFNSLEKDDLSKIFDIEFGKLHDLILKESKLDVKVTDKIKELIISKCEPKYGARSLKRLINEYVQKEICKKMLEVSVKGKVTVTVDIVEDDKVKVEFK